MNKWTKSQINFVVKKYSQGFDMFEISKMYNDRYDISRSRNSIKHCVETNTVEKPLKRVLVIDIETAPINVYGWGLYNENHSVSQMIENSYMLSWSAKWLGEDKVYYADQRNKKGKHLKNDKSLVKKLIKLIKQADIILGQNSDAFDLPFIKFRMAIHKLGKLNKYDRLDTKKIAKRHLKLPSYGLEYMSKTFNKKHIKSTHSEFHGFSLWLACMDGNLKAFQSMAKYNPTDILATEELFVDTLAKFETNKIAQDAVKAYNAVKKNTK